MAVQLLLLCVQACTFTAPYSSPSDVDGSNSSACQAATSGVISGEKGKSPGPKPFAIEVHVLPSNRWIKLSRFSRLFPTGARLYTMLGWFGLNNGLPFS